MAIKFTQGRVRNFEYKRDGKPAFFYDSDIKGLGIRVTPGAKVYIFQARLNDKVIRIKIGDETAWNLEDARKEAARLKTVIDGGIDPRIEKQEKIADQEAKRIQIIRQEVKLSDAWPIYIEARKHQWSQRHLMDHVRIAHLGGKQLKRGEGKTKPGALAALMDTKLPDLTQDRIKRWLKDESQKRKTQARIAFDALRAFTNWANETSEYQGLINGDICSRRIKKENLPAKKAKDDCLQREQLQAWFQAVQGIYNPVISAYLQGLLLTGARREELAGLKWEDVNFKWNSITIHDKVDGKRTIPLTPYIAFLINALPRLNEWVFSSPSAASGRIQEPRIAHNKALAIAVIDGLTLHGLRRSFGTLSEWVECPTGVVAQIMGHKPSAIAEKHYRRRPLDLLRLWHEKIEKFILKQAGVQQPKSDNQPGFRVVGQ